MNTFKVIAEEKHKFKKDVLIVYAFNDGENYGVDVNNIKSNFGRFQVKDKSKAKYLFNVLNEFIALQDDYLNACEFVSSILSYEEHEYENVILSIHTYRRHIDKLEALAITQMLDLDFDQTVFPGGTIVIKIFKRNSKEIFGEFILIQETNKFMFHFF